jgi:hypothetical protein
LIPAVHRTFAFAARPKATSSLGRDNGSKSAAIAINKKITELGRNRQWKEMLLIHKKEKESFDGVCYATMMSQLGRIRSVDSRNPNFSAFLDDLGNQVKVRGFRWLGPRGVGNIMNTIGKMNLKNHNTSRILFSQLEKHAEWFVQEGNPQDLRHS